MSLFLVFSFLPPSFGLNCFDQVFTFERCCLKDDGSCWDEPGGFTRAACCGDEGASGGGGMEGETNSTQIKQNLMSTEWSSNSESIRIGEILSVCLSHPFSFERCCLEADPSCWEGSSFPMSFENCCGFACFPSAPLKSNNTFDSCCRGKPEGWQRGGGEEGACWSGQGASSGISDFCCSPIFDRVLKGERMRRWQNYMVKAADFLERAQNFTVQTVYFSGPSTEHAMSLYQSVWGALNSLFAAGQLVWAFQEEGGSREKLRKYEELTSMKEHRVMFLKNAIEILRDLIRLRDRHSSPGLSLLEVEDPAPHIQVFLRKLCLLDAAQCLPPQEGLEEVEREAYEQSRGGRLSWLEEAILPEVFRAERIEERDSLVRQAQEGWKELMDIPPALILSPPPSGEGEKRREVHSLFPTRIVTSSLSPSHLSSNDCDELFRIALAKFSVFAVEQQERDPLISSEALNNLFFGAQYPSERDHFLGGGGGSWPELYTQSLAFQRLKEGVKEEAKEALRAMGLGAVNDMEISIWASIYRADGAQLRFHDHPLSLISGTFYPKASGTPIAFADPRGSSFYEYVNPSSREGGSDMWEPTPPFHRLSYYFAEDGDLIFFPSWLLHQVLPHESRTGHGTRVAFAFNIHRPAGGNIHSWTQPV